MTDNSSERLTGYVKWFNSKTGYGFITVVGEDRDIFVHYSNVKVDGLQYTYLVQGEYVEFDLAETNGENDKYSHQAVNITGIKNGPLMCKTRSHNRQYSIESETSELENVKRVVKEKVRPLRLLRTPTLRGEENEDFKTVVRKRSVKKNVV